MTVDVFRKLRKKMFLGVLTVFLVLLALYVIIFNMYFQISERRSAILFLNEISANKGLSLRQDYASRQAKRKKWSLFSFVDYRGTPYFSVYLNHDGSIHEVIHRFSEDMTDEDVDSFVQQLVKQQSERGTVGMLAYSLTEQEPYNLLVAFDRTKEQEFQRRMLATYLAVTLVCVAVLAVVAEFISRIITKPVEKEFAKQQDFIADISHELKTPISVISANVSVLENDMPSNKWIQYIKTECQRMNTLVHDMLFLAKEDSGRLTMDKHSFDLANAISCAVLPFESVAFEDKKLLEFDIPKDQLFIEGDEERIKQIAVILTDNAIKNSYEHSVIKVSVGVSADRYFVSVYNEGDGIPPEDLDRIFDRFYRVDKSRDRKTGGYGLGLSIAQTIAKEHGGIITVKSEEKKFAQFTLELPREHKKHSLAIYSLLR